MLKTKILAIILFCVFGNMGSYGHPLHLSIINIDIEEDSIWVSMRISEHDLSHVISVQEKQKEHFNIYDNSEIVISYIKDYVLSCFSLSTAGNEIQLDFAKKESDDHDVLLFFKGKGMQGIETIDIENSLLCQQYPSQKNIMIVSYLDTEKGLEFSSVETKKTITLVVDKP